MGFRVKLKRLLCSPVSMMLWLRNRMKTGIGTDQTSHIRTIVLLPVAVFIVTLMIWTASHTFSLWMFGTHSRNFVRSSDGKISDDESFLFLYGLTRSNTLDDARIHLGSNGKLDDNFSKNNYLHLKLQRLIALSYLSSPVHTYASTDLGDKPDRKLLSGSGNPAFSKNTNFTFLLNELNIAIKVQNFYLRQWGCPEISSLKFPSHVLKTQHTMTGNVVFEGKNIALQASVGDVDELIAGKCGSSDSDKSRDNENRCFLLKNRRMLQQYLFLQELSHPSIVKLYGVCMSLDPNLSPTFTIAKETGITVDIEKIKAQPWNIRLKIAQDLVSLAAYLAKTKLGSIILSSWSADNFIITQDSSSVAIKLTNFDQGIVLNEKACEYDQDCTIGVISSATKCDHGVCKGYNDKLNLHNMYKVFLGPVLEEKVPDHISSETIGVFDTLKKLQCNSTVLLQLLRFLQSSSQKLDPVGHPIGDGNENSLLHEGLNHHHDGLQVDSWEQHESHVAINEVDFNQIPPDQNNAVPNIDNPGPEEDEYKDTYGYKKIENADYPGRYDYYCPHSKAEWGCVVSLRRLEEAAKKCDDDPKCKAFVTMPHLRKEGWIIVILKSENTRAVDHAGTTVYIKPSGENKSKKEKENGDTNRDAGVAKLCVQDLLQTQESVREAREKLMMKVCDWEGMTDSKWQTVVLEASVSDATKFKPSRGKMAVGGQMNVILDSSSKPSPALFLAKKGPKEFHLAQLATYHLDRMLGLYKILPAFLRTLTEQEMTDAGFPVDIGGNQFDVFRQLKNADKSLSGTIVPMVTGRIGVEHYISVPKLAQITNAVTPFSKRQWDDLEYLLLMWLASLPVPTKGHSTLQGHLIHIKADEALKSEPSSDVLSYFFNCQFPRIAIDVLRNLRTTHCNFGDQLIARVRTTYPDLPVSAFSFEVPVADIATRNANRLLEVVDLCIRKFGDNAVLYDS